MNCFHLRDIYMRMRSAVLVLERAVVLLELDYGAIAKSRTEYVQLFTDKVAKLL